MYMYNAWTRYIIYVCILYVCIYIYICICIRIHMYTYNAWTCVINRHTCIKAWKFDFQAQKWCFYTLFMFMGTHMYDSQKYLIRPFLFPDQANLYIRNDFLGTCLPVCLDFVDDWLRLCLSLHFVDDWLRQTES